MQPLSGQDFSKTFKHLTNPKISTFTYNWFTHTTVLKISASLTTSTPDTYTFLTELAFDGDHQQVLMSLEEQDNALHRCSESNEKLDISWGVMSDDCK